MIRRIAYSLCVLLFGTSLAHGQTTDPRGIEFLRSGDQNLITRYDLQFRTMGGTTPVMTVGLGKPTPDADGLTRVNFASVLTTFPPRGVPYEARVAAVGANGTAVSIASGSFIFACRYSVTPTTASIASAGGPGSVTVVADPACAWTATSSASWLSVKTGQSGTGNGTVAYEVAQNLSTSPQTASLTVGGVDVSMTVAAHTGPVTTRIATEAALQAAVRALTTGSTILIEPGTYRLTAPLAVSQSISNVVIRGASGNAADVVLVGAGMQQASGPATAFSVTGQVAGIIIADLSVRDTYDHAIVLAGRASGVRIQNVRLANSGLALITAQPTTSGGGVSDALVEDSVLEYTAAGRNGAGGLDVQAGKAWIIRGNLFRNIALTGGAVARPAIVAWKGSADTLVDGNLFMNTQTGVSLGISDSAGVDHSGGIVRNNMFYRSASQTGGAAISVVRSPRTQVVHNTVLLSGTYASPIEYRGAETMEVTIANNLLDGNVTALQGASGSVTHNDVAFAALFIDAPNGDLHLVPPAASAIDAGRTLTSALQDWDGDARPTGAAPDLGADEAMFESAVTPSPADTTVPPAVKIVDKELATWTIGSDSSILRNGARTAGHGSTIYWSGEQVYVLGTDNRWYSWTGTSWAFFGTTKPGPSAPAKTPSADKTQVPPAAAIIDSALATWTLGSGSTVMRDGVHVSAGYGTVIYWFSGRVHVLGTDNRWYLWTGTSWSFYATTRPGVVVPPTKTASADKTEVPPATSIVDSALATWTIGSGSVILRDGVQAGSGYGTLLYWYSGKLYVLGTDSRWHQWTGSSWVFFSATKPGVVAPPTKTASADKTQVPPAASIIDGALATWTIGSGSVILRDGVHVGSGYGSVLYWSGGKVYVLGTDSRWYLWSGSQWTYFGQTKPA